MNIIIRGVYQLELFIVRLRDMPLPVEVEYGPYEEGRTLHQNRWYWWDLSVIANQVVVDGRKYDADIWHEYYKRKFLGFKQTTLKGMEYIIANSTTKLSKKEMYDYRYQVESDAVQELGVVFPDYHQEAG